MDRLDHRMLAVLGRHGRASNVELAEAIHLSPTAVARRQKALEEAGVIRGYSADIDAAAFGLRTTVVVQIALKSQSETDLVEFEQAVRNCDSVLQCFLMSGTDDYLLILLVRDLPDEPAAVKIEKTKHVREDQLIIEMRAGGGFIGRFTS